MFGKVIDIAIGVLIAVLAVLAIIIAGFAAYQFIFGGFHI